VAPGHLLPLPVPVRRWNKIKFTTIDY
jgi:hypothetical protein